MEFKFEKDENLKSIVSKLPENINVTKDILGMIGNNTTKIEQDKDIKNSYYVYLQDKIYLADNERNNSGVSRICLISHECKHSIQSKFIQSLNFLLSNIEFIYFLVVSILLIFLNNKILLISYIAINIISIIPRLYLEIDAVLSSIKISDMYLQTKLDEESKEKLIDVYNNFTKSMLPLFIVSLLKWKIVRIVFTIIIFVF